MGCFFFHSFGQQKIGLAVVTIVLWILAGVGLLYHNPLANYAAWFMFSIPLMEISHYIFPLLEGGSYHYFAFMVLQTVERIRTNVALAIVKGDQIVYLKGYGRA